MTARLRAATLATTVAVVAAAGGAHVERATAHSTKTTHVEHAAYILRLHGRSLVPNGVDLAGIRRAGPGPQVHFIVQLRSNPSVGEGRYLRHIGLHLLEYIGGRSYNASAPGNRLAMLRRSMSCVPRCPTARPTRCRSRETRRRGTLGPDRRNSRQADRHRPARCPLSDRAAAPPSSRRPSARTAARGARDRRIVPAVRRGAARTQRQRRMDRRADAPPTVASSGAADAANVRGIWDCPIRPDRRRRDRDGARRRRRRRPPRLR